MAHRRRILIASALCVLCVPAAAWADGLEALETFLRSTRSGRADFTQVVTAPAREGQAPRTRQSSGSFEFQRPNRFRFTYRKPFVQTIVADGQTLWLHDPDLNQVTARRQAQALGTTPAALIAAAPDLGALRQEFELVAAPDRDGLQWVQATPKAREGALRDMRVGFRGGELAALEIQDSLGQQSVLRFGRMEINPALPAQTFQFRPPPGADVLRP
ncbi:MAG: putative Outer-rane lipoprotein carrier protein precursor [Pseudomonadota bacterium]|jgi:outer membrane lipoprotein carrier protein